MACALLQKKMLSHCAILRKNKNWLHTYKFAYKGSSADKVKSLSAAPFLLRTMKKDLFKTIVSLFAALLMISVLTFLLAKLSSADQAENYLRVSKIQVTPQSLEKAREYLGLNQPWPQQYLGWLIKALRGDFGTSYLLKVPVLPLVLERFQSTLSLGLTSFALILLTSIPLGIFSAVYKGSLFDKVVRFLSFSSVSMPSFWLGYMLIVIFAVQLRWLPVSGKQDFSSLILPSLTLSMSLIGQYIALIRKAVIEQMKSVHVENALLRGVSKFFLVKNHLLRNSLPAIATGLSLTLVYLLTGSLIVEEVFSWNGVGSLFVDALQAVDLPIIQCCMLLFGLLFLGNNVLTQQLPVWIDPRVRKRRSNV